MLQAFYTELEDHDEIDVSPFRKLGRNRRKVVMKESYAQPIYLLQDEFLTVMKTEVPEPCRKQKMHFFSNASWLHIPEHTRSLSGSLLGYKTIP